MPKEPPTDDKGPSRWSTLKRTAKKSLDHTTQLAPQGWRRKRIVRQWRCECGASLSRSSIHSRLMSLPTGWPKTIGSSNAGDLGTKAPFQVSLHPELPHSGSIDGMPFIVQPKRKTVSVLLLCWQIRSCRPMTPTLTHSMQLEQRVNHPYLPTYAIPSDRSSVLENTERDSFRLTKG